MTEFNELDFKFGFRVIARAWIKSYTIDCYFRVYCNEQGSWFDEFFNHYSVESELIIGIEYRSTQTPNHHIPLDQREFWHSGEINHLVFVGDVYIPLHNSNIKCLYVIFKYPSDFFLVEVLEIGISVNNKCYIQESVLSNKDEYVLVGYSSERIKCVMGG